MVKDLTGFSILCTLAFLPGSAWLGQCFCIPARLPVPVFTSCILPFSPGLWSCLSPVSPLRILSSTRQGSPHMCLNLHLIYKQGPAEHLVCRQCLYQPHQAAILRSLCSSQGCMINVCPMGQQFSRQSQVHLLATLIRAMLRGDVLWGFQCSLCECRRALIFVSCIYT